MSRRAAIAVPTVVALLSGAGALIGWFSPAFLEQLHYVAAAVGAVFVVGLGWLIRKSRHKGVLDAPLITDPPGPEEFPHRAAERQETGDRHHGDEQARNRQQRLGRGGVHVTRT